MARGVSFGRGYAGSLRPPLSPAIQKALTASPVQQAAQQAKAAQFPAPRVTKLKLGRGGLPGQRLPRGNPFKSQPFFGE